MAGITLIQKLQKLFGARAVSDMMGRTTNVQTLAQGTNNPFRNTFSPKYLAKNPDGVDEAAQSILENMQFAFGNRNIQQMKNFEANVDTLYNLKFPPKPGEAKVVDISTKKQVTGEGLESLKDDLGLPKDIPPTSPLGESITKAKRIDKTIDQRAKEYSIMDEAFRRPLIRDMLLNDTRINLPQNIRKSLRNREDLQRGADPMMDPLKIYLKYYNYDINKLEQLEDMANIMSIAGFNSDEIAKSFIKRGGLEPKNKKIVRESLDDETVEMTEKNLLDDSDDDIPFAQGGRAGYVKGGLSKLIKLVQDKFGKKAITTADQLDRPGFVKLKEERLKEFEDFKDRNPDFQLPYADKDKRVIPEGMDQELVDLAILQGNFARKYEGRINPKLMEKILNDTDAQRVKEIISEIEQAFIMQEKGMGNEEIINILLEGANRKKQASGGIVGQLHMNKGGSVTTPKRGLVNEAGSYAGVQKVREGKTYDVIASQLLDPTFDLMDLEELEDILKSLGAYKTGGRVGLSTGGPINPSDYGIFPQRPGGLPFPDLDSYDSDYKKLIKKKKEKKPSDFAFYLDRLRQLPKGDFVEKEPSDFDPHLEDLIDSLYREKDKKNFKKKRAPYIYDEDDLPWWMEPYRDNDDIDVGPAVQKVAQGGRVGLSKGGGLLKLYNFLKSLGKSKKKTPLGYQFPEIDDNFRKMLKEKMDKRQLKDFDITDRKPNAMGGRIGLQKGGPPNPGRRNFMKLLAGLASIPVLGKFFKGAKVAKTIVPIKNASTAMPEWFPKFVDKYISNSIGKKIDADITEFKNPDLPNIKVTKHDDGRVFVEGNNEYNEGYQIDYQPPGYEVVDEKTGKAVKTQGEFEAVEGRHVALSPEDYDTEPFFVDDLDELTTIDVAEMEKYSTGKITKTVKDAFKQDTGLKKGMHSYDMAVGKAENQADILKDADLLDEDFASGGRVGMLAGGGLLKAMLRNLAKEKGMSGSEMLAVMNYKALPSKIKNLMTKEQFEQLKSARLKGVKNFRDMMQTRLDFNKSIQQGRDIDDKGTGMSKIFDLLEEDFGKKIAVPKNITEKDILEMEQMIKNMEMKGRKSNAAGGLAGQLKL